MAIRQTRQHPNGKKIKASCKRTPENAEFVRAAKHHWYFEIDFSLGLADAHLLCACAMWFMAFNAPHFHASIKSLNFSSCRINYKRLSRKFIELCRFFCLRSQTQKKSNTFCVSFIKTEVPILPGIIIMRFTIDSPYALMKCACVGFLPDVHDLVVFCFTFCIENTD